MESASFRALASSSTFWLTSTIKRVLGHLAVLLNIGALPHGDVDSSEGLTKIPLHLHVGFFLLGLSPVLIQAIDLNISTIS